MSKRILVAGSVNADIVLSVAAFPKPGETISTLERAFYPGGKGANQALAARRAGAELRFAGKRGDDDEGRKAVALLEASGMDLRFLEILPDARSGSAFILVDSSGENCIVLDPGANALWSGEAAAYDGYLEGCGLALAQLEIPMEATRLLLERARALGVFTLLNPAPARREAVGLLSLVDLLILNETEAGCMSGVDLGEGASDAALDQAAAALLSLGARACVITLGASGVYVAEGGTRRRLGAYRVEAIDTTAAGDVFVGALAAALAEGCTMQEAAAWAQAASAIAVTRRGAQTSVPARAEIDAFIAERSKA